MNYYAQGGQPYGLNSLADTDYYSRGVQYKDGVPSFGIGGSLKKAWKGTVGKIEDIAKPITKPITDAVKPLLPYAQYIAPFIPGVGPLMAAGIGALGSGFAGGGGFNFKRGLMGGMTAYGLSNLYAGLQAAGGATPGSAIPSTDIAAANVTPDPIAALNESQGFTSAGDATLLNETVSAPSMGSQFVDQAGSAGQGIKNLAGVGETTLSSADAAKAFTGSGATLTNTAGSAFMGYTGGEAIKEAEQMKNEADLAAAKDDTERNAILARIEESKQRGIRAVSANPYQFAYGGPVDDEAGFDDFNNYTGGGIASMAKGGMAPRFLSGGGDGMSDDIPATINDKQPARLADGEFVIPADVVSHLGNGSSKAGAKQLYSMMDKVRHARTGNKKQGKQITPAKYMPA
jgi:hypothetical protein